MNTLDLKTELLFAELKRGNVYFHKRIFVEFFYLAR